MYILIVQSSPPSVSRIVSPPQLKLSPWNTDSLQSLSPALGNHLYRAVARTLTTLGTCYSWSHAGGALRLWLLWLHRMSSRFTHLVARVGISFHWHSCWVCIPCFADAFIHGRIFGWFPAFGCCEWCCYECWCIDTYLSPWFQILWEVQLLDPMVILCLLFWGTSILFNAVGISHFTFSPPRIPISPFPYQHLLLVFLFCFCFIRAILMSVKWHLFVVSFAFL